MNEEQGSENEEQGMMNDEQRKRNDGIFSLQNKIGEAIFIVLITPSPG